VFFVLKKELSSLYQSQLKTHKMIKAFKIYKDGVTANWVTILIPENDLTDNLLNSKISKYIYLGYKIEMI